MKQLFTIRSHWYDKIKTFDEAFYEFFVFFWFIYSVCVAVSQLTNTYVINKRLYQILFIKFLGEYTEFPKSPYALKQP